MNRVQFDHIIRAAAGVTGLNEFVVVGSQAILAVLEDALRRCSLISLGRLEKLIAGEANLELHDRLTKLLPLIRASET